MTAPEVQGKGGPSGDIGTTFTELNEAAKAACKWIWDRAPYRDRYEYCGAIYRDADGIRVGLPMTEKRPTRCGSPSGPPEAPPDTLLLAKYHSHRILQEPSSRDQQN